MTQVHILTSLVHTKICPYEDTYIDVYIYDRHIYTTQVQILTRLVHTKIDRYMYIYDRHLHMTQVRILTSLVHTKIPVQGWRICTPNATNRVFERLLVWL